MEALPKNNKWRICPECGRYIGYHVPLKRDGYRFCKYCGCKISRDDYEDKLVKAKGEE